jgi:GT2 family glycosyltransferase
MSTPRRLVVLMTCHNRREKTLACLRALALSALPESVRVEVFVVDDGCTDGTPAAIRAGHPEIRVLPGDGKLYWNGGMRVAFAAAAHTAPDFYLWLNDDTRVHPDTVARMVATCDERARATRTPCIVVGTTRSGPFGPASYGGLRRRSAWTPLRCALVQPEDGPRPCETMNGNCVLIPSSVAAALGNLDATFVHSMGDMDYGFRARRAGFGLWVLPGYAGECANDNAATGSWNDPAAPLGERLRKLMQPKGLPWRAWTTLAYRHGGPLWPAYWVWPYVKVVLTSLRHAVS